MKRWKDSNTPTTECYPSASCIFRTEPQPISVTRSLWQTREEDTSQTCFISLSFSLYQSLSLHLYQQGLATQVLIFIPLMYKPWQMYDENCLVWNSSKLVVIYDNRPTYKRLFHETYTYWFDSLCFETMCWLSKAQVNRSRQAVWS